jgi:hypothetical protein
MTKKQRSKKPQNCVGCDFLKAALGDAQKQFQEATSSLAQWKRIWTTDSKHWTQKIREQADTIAALIDANRSLRNELDRYEKFHTVSYELRGTQAR